MIRFRPLEESDLPQVEAWLRAEHVAEWWRDPLEIALEKRREALEGRREVEHYAILEDGRPVGLIQTYRVADHPEWGELVGAEPEAAGVDLFVGEPDAVGRGLGAEILREFARTVVFSGTETTAVVATVEEANRRSWRAFEKAGFRHVRDVEEDGLPHRLMRLERRYAQ
jgi:RimJ/RimL family protein N-acetyltransferase